MVQQLACTLCTSDMVQWLACTLCTSDMVQWLAWPLCASDMVQQLAWWWLLESKHVATCIIDKLKYCSVLTGIYFI